MSADRLCSASQRPASSCILSIIVTVSCVASIAFALRAIIITSPERGDVWWSLLAIAMVLGVAGLRLRIWPQLSSDEDDTTTKRERLLLVGGVVCLIGASTVFTQLDDLLLGFHLPGDAAYGINAATQFPAPPLPDQRAATICDAVISWARFTQPYIEPTEMPGCWNTTPILVRNDEASEPFPRYTNGPSDAPITVLGWQSLVDSAFLVPAYVLVLILAITWCRRAVSADRCHISQTSSRTSTNHVIRWGYRAGPVVWIAAIADWVENTISMLLLHQVWSDYTTDGTMPPLDSGSWERGVVFVLVVLTAVKFTTLFLASAYVVWCAIVLLRHGGAPDRRWTRVPGLVQTLVAVRIPLLAIMLLYILTTQGQGSELIWSWAPTDGELLPGEWSMWFSLGLVVLFAITIFLVSRWMLRVAWALGTVETPSGRHSSTRKGYTYEFVFVTVVLAVVFLAITGEQQALKSWIPLIIIATIAIAGVLLGGGWPASAWRRPGLGQSVAPYLLSGLVLVVLGRVALGNTTHLIAYQSLRGVPFPGWGHLVFSVVLLFAGAVAVGVAWVVWPRRPVNAVSRPPIWWRPILGLVACIGCWSVIRHTVMADDNLYTWTPTIGVIGIVCAFLTLVTVIGACLIVLVDIAVPRPPRLFRAMRIEHLPVIGIILIWFLLASNLPPHETENLHNARISPDSGETDTSDWVKREGEQLAAAFEQWRYQNCLVEPEGIVTGARPFVPLILISTAGGGMRAAAWTSYVVDEILGTGGPEPVIDSSSISDCTDGIRPTDVGRSSWVFAASGVSGGSVGLATYVAQLRQPEAEPTNAWVQAWFGNDFLAPTIAWMLFAEAPWSFTRANLHQDRAAVLEQAWEQASGTTSAENVESSPSSAAGNVAQMEMFDLRSREQRWEASLLAAGTMPEDPAATQEWILDRYDDVWGTPTEQDFAAKVPLMIFNGTSVESGCRFNGSVLEGNARGDDEPSTRCLSSLHVGDQTSDPDPGVFGATNDLADFLCVASHEPGATGQDLRLSTAAFLSARFPFISPTGHLKQCERGSESETTRPYPPETYVVDGGYLENSGAASIIHLWSGLQPLIEKHNQDPRSRAVIVPYLIQIDSGYADPVGPGVVPVEPQFVAPLTTFLALRDGFQAMERQSAQLLFSQPYVVMPEIVPEPTTVSTPDSESEQSTTVQVTDRYAHITLVAHPGPQAQLGWILSDIAFADLCDQLVRQQPALDEALRWFGVTSESTESSHERCRARR